MFTASTVEMDVPVTLKRASAELREISDEWRKVGCHLGVGGLHIIGANYDKDNERCLSDVLNDWIRNGSPSWIKLCNALDNAGLFSKANQIREKYCRPSTPDRRGRLDFFGTNYIILKLLSSNTII